MPIEIAKAKPVIIPDSNPADPAYLKIRDLIYRISGIYHSEEKLYLLIGRCARRMVMLGGGHCFGIFGIPHHARKPRRGVALAAE